MDEPGMPERSPGLVSVSPEVGPSEAAPPVILASGSRFRAQMLTAAGVPFTVSVAGVDEAAVRESLGAEGASTADAAIALGELKAIAVSRRYSDALVIGSDQMLDCNGVWFEKPVDRDHARASLMALAGREQDRKSTRLNSSH